MMIYEIHIPAEEREDGDSPIVYARGGDKNEAWGKVNFRGYMVNSFTDEEWNDYWGVPEVLA